MSSVIENEVITVRVPNTLKNQIKSVASLNMLSVSDIARQSFQMYLKENNITVSRPQTWSV